MTSEEVIQIAKEASLGLPPSLTTPEALALRKELEEEELPEGAIEDLPTEL
jgi:hypothetical protein